MATPQAGQGMSYWKSKRLSTARLKEISIVDKFEYGYRNREDITNLPQGVLVVGSQNVLIDTSSRVENRKGYVLDGATSTVNASIKSSFQWQEKENGERHLRAGFLTSAGNDGKLQFRYVSPAGTVTWTDLLSSLTTTSYNFTTFWDTSELVRTCLFVNGTSNIFEWSGAYDTVASFTNTTVVLTNPVTTSGFFVATAAKQHILLNGIDYTYTYSGATPNTLTITAGGSGNLTTDGVENGMLVVQKVYTHANGGGNDLPATFPNSLIGTLNNQVYVASTLRPTVYLSKVNTYVDYSYSTPRVPGDGGLAHLDANIVGFIPQEKDMYVTAGQNFWYHTSFIQTVAYNGAGAFTAETFAIELLKSNNLQAAKSQSCVNNMGNYVIMINNEPAFEILGRIENILGTPQTNNLSDSIKLDFDNYDFTNASVFSWRRYLLVALPAEGLVRIYNLTIKAWEAPQTLPITSFYTVNGALYGHSSQTSESYKLFTGYSDRATSTSKGVPILSVASFSYQNYGTRTVLKNCNEFYIEGYINANTTLNCEMNYELDGCMTTKTFNVNGSDTQIVCIPSDESSLGKVSFGKEKFGGDKSASLTGLPPKFRVIKTFTREPNFYEHQFSFNTYGEDQSFKIIAFGTNSAPASDTNVLIEQ